jgi:SAM-dependent methyltransferase
MRSASSLQRAYYARTAHDYETRHVLAGDEHGVALRYVSAIAREFDLRSVLDVGRAVAYLREALPGAAVVGAEPVLNLLQVACSKPDLGCVGLVSASGDELPFDDATFDIVCQFGVLHHVAHPNAMVKEMMRVARRAVFLSDTNRFGQGPLPVRGLKLVLAQCGLWPAANFVKTRGTGYTITEGDGLSYSYSVFDSLDTLHGWADRVVLVPTSNRLVRGWWSPLLTSSHVLLCAIRDQ